MGEVSAFTRLPVRILRKIVDLGKVLAGIQVPKDEQAAFDQFLKKLDYHYVEETENPVYDRFLRG
jgi:threonine dehydratase